jgi:hypothetical protein
MTAPIERIPYRDTWTVCADCGHDQVHHGHINHSPLGRSEWVYEDKCWVYVEPERTASGRRKGRAGCKCKGWRS